jgi:UDP-N-acetylglucosamine 2-epimerase
MGIVDTSIFMVFGKKSKEELISQGINPKNIIITGPAIYDEIIKYKSKNSENNSIALMTSGFYMCGLISKEKYFAYIKKLLQETNTTGMEITIKLHPEESLYIKEYEKIAKKYKNIKQITASENKEDLYNIITNASLVINFGSSVALESLILDKPVITILGLHKSPIFDFDIVTHRLKESGASLVITTKDSIKKAIEQIIKNKNQFKKKREKFLSESCYKIDGNSSKRIAREIKKIVTNRTKFQ